VFAASIMLVFVSQGAAESEVLPVLSLVRMAVEILETMDECVVAAKAAKMLQSAVERVEKKLLTATDAPDSTWQGPDATLHLNPYWGPLNFIGGDMELDFALHLCDFEGADSSLMSLAGQ
jgi:hypothetical protein